MENGHNLKGTNHEAGQTHGEEQEKWEIPQNTRGHTGFTKVEEDTDAAETEAAENQEAHGAPSRSHHWSVIVQTKQDRGQETETHQTHCPDHYHYSNGILEWDKLH